MTDFAITVRDRTVTVDRRPTVVVSGSVNVYTMSVALDDAWDGYTCRAVFRCGFELREVLIVDGACAVPWEALVANGSLYIGVYGINGDKRMPTCWTSERIYVASGTVTADASQDPSPTVFEELVEQTADNRAAAEAARDAAESAKQGTAADRLVVAGDKTAVAADREAVESRAQQVTSDATRAENAANAAVDAATEAAKSEAAAKDASAQAGRDAAQTAQDRESADASKLAAETAKTAAQTAETNAETAQTAAEAARTGAQTAETNAGTYATNAGNSATAAAGSATNAQSAQTAAESARDAAVTAKTAAETARDTAVLAKTAAETAETNAETAESNAQTYATNAGNSATAALTAQSAAETAAQAAANSAASLVVVNDLTTGGTDKALSAEQGKVLSASISDLTTDLSNSSVIGGEIYGAYWDKGSTPTLTRLNLAKGATVNLGVDANYALNEFDTSSLFSEFSEVTDSYGNVFIRIPRIYIKKVDTTGHKAWYASRRPFTGAYLPKCFWDFANNKELDYVDVGAYTASSADGTKLDSKSGAYPLINKNIVQMRTMAQANGAGYQQLDIHVVDLLQTLFVIEQATIQSQSKVAGYTSCQYSATHTATVAETAVNRIIVATATAALYEIGQAISIGTSLGGNQIFCGRTITAKTVIDASNTAIEFDGTAVNIDIGNIVYNTGIQSGFSANIAASVGSPVSNSSGKQPFVWHGIENLFGSVYQFVDGINVNERQAWVCPDAASYASNLFTAPYEQLSYVNGATDGYITAMGHDPARPYAALPAAVGGSSTTYYGDYYYQSTGQRIAVLGGSWSYGASAGLFFWGLSALSSSAGVPFGGRLVKKPL
jgi:hypothetical protein